MISEKKIYALLVAGGKGTRMGNTEKPKQFLEFAGKPVLIHTAERFAAIPDFAKILILTPQDWIAYTGELLERYLPDQTERFQVLPGGESRNDTLMNGIRYLEETFGLTDDTIAVTHDCVRPLVSERIIRENIALGEKYGACNTVIPATDTIMISKDGKTIVEVPDRSEMYQSQTPQTFRVKQLQECYARLTEEEKARLTDACRIMVLCGKPVHMVLGEAENFKITWQGDLELAELYEKRQKRTF